jgi:hypothetical protein
MKKLKIEHVIQKLLTEQTTAKVRVVIKRTMGTSNQDARAAGAVFGFRIKATAKKTDGKLATQNEVYRAISQVAESTPEIMYYANDKYVILVSDDQRDAEKNYLYTFWVFPAAYWDDITNIAKQSSDARDKIVWSGIYRLKVGGAPVQTWELVKSIPQQIPIYAIDPQRLKRFEQWANQVKKINKPVPADDLVIPDVTNLPTQLPAPPDFNIVFDTKYQWGQLPPETELIQYIFTGTLKMPDEIPIEGKVLRDGREVFSGVFNETNKQTNRTTPWKGVATKLPFTREHPVTNEPVLATYSGPIAQGYPTDGTVEFDASTKYVGTLNKFAFNNGELYENGAITRFYENGDPYAYTASYSGNVLNTSPEIYIKDLQRDIIAMYNNNKTYLDAEFSEYPVILTKLQNLQANGAWDEKLIKFLNMYISKYYFNTDVSGNPRASTEVPGKIHVWIQKHRTETIPPRTPR